jgi:hypothetical protein
MGDHGRAAYITLNNFDFLFIVSNGLFGISAIGIMLGYLLRNKKLATRLSLLGLLPALFDAIESVCFRLIVINPNNDHPVLSAIAATATKAKFAGYNLALVLIVLLFIITIVVWFVRHRKKVVFKT